MIPAFYIFGGFLGGPNPGIAAAGVFRLPRVKNGGFLPGQQSFRTTIWIFLRFDLNLPPMPLSCRLS